MNTKRYVILWFEKFPIFVVLCTGLAIILIFISIGNKSLWLDEALTISIAQRWGTMWQILLYREPYMWLYYIFFYLWTRFGTGEAYARSLSALFSIATIPCVYLLGSTIFSKKVGNLAAFLMCINVFFIQYAQEIRSYSLLLLLTTLSTYFFIISLSADSKKYAIGYALVSAASIYAHQIAILYIATQFLAVLFLPKSKRHTRSLIATGIFIVLSVFPLWIFRISDTNINWIVRPSLYTLVNFFMTLSGGHIVLLSIYFFCLISAINALFLQYKSYNDVTKWKKILLMLLLIVPVGFSFLFSVFVKPIFLSRYLIPSLVPFLVLCSFGITTIRQALVRNIYLALLILFSSISIFTYYLWISPPFVNGFSIPVKENWRETTNFILSQARQGDAITFYAYFIHVPFDYYLVRYPSSGSTVFPPYINLSSSVYTIGGIQPNPDFERMQKLPAHFSRVWLVLSHNSSSQLERDKQSSEIVDQLSKLYARRTVTSFEGIVIFLFSDPNGAPAKNPAFF